MADVDPTVIDVLTPFDVDEQLRRRVAEAVIAQGGIRHDALNAFLRAHLGGKDVDKGALFSQPVIEGAAGYVSSGQNLGDLSGSLLHPRLIAALEGLPGDEYRFLHPAYQHQVEAWKQLLNPNPHSVLVASGTGSGKTECFLVPLLDDLTREAEEHGRLTGVRAVLLYPLNALIASQQERLRRWTAPFNGDIRFALYNGLMTDKRENDRDKDEAKSPEQVLYRRTLRRDPAPILVTNNTMLEYMTIRKEDHPIVQASKGMLRWIVIDEAHSYVGSSAAEVSLLLRRVLQAFGVRAQDVRFVATSATIGESDDRAKVDLQRYLADLADVPFDRVKVVLGQREQVHLPRPDNDQPLTPSDLLTDKLAAHPAVQALIRKIESEPLALSSIAGFASTAGVLPADLVKGVASPTCNGGPLLPLRIHQFIRAVPGMWSCINPDCDGDKPTDWPFGAIAWERDKKCRTCSAPTFEIVSCRECGEPWLNAFDHGDWLLSQPSPPDRDEFAAASARESDADDGGDESEGDTAPTTNRSGGQRRLIGVRANVGLVQREIDPLTGAFPEKRGQGHVVWISRPADDGCCPRCQAAPTAAGSQPLWPYRFGAPFLIQNATPTMLEGVNPSPERGRVQLPAGGRQILSFTDSRQGTARFAANVETMSERGYVRAFLYHAVQKSGTPRALEADERAELELQRAALGPHALNDKTFAALLAKVDKELGGGSGAAVPWTDAVNALAKEPMLKQGIGKVWDADRDQRYADHPEALANYLILRELARRPRRSNAVETMGLAKLVFPTIEKLAETNLPGAMLRKECSIEAWREFLYFLLDTTIRSSFALNISEADARWLLPRRAFLRTIVGPGREKQENSNIVWPTARPGTGIKANAVLALERFLNLDSSEPEDRAIINDLLTTAWNHVQSLLEGTGSTYALDLRKAEIASIRECWLCPVTFRVLPRLVFGRSPHGIRGNQPGANDRPTSLVMPNLPQTFPEGDADRKHLAEWVRTDSEIATLRGHGVWGNLHERAATFAPYIRAEEHSAQQPPYRLRKFEEQFKRGEINLLACSTTMEMGVDIGSVEAILNTNVPPSIANYRQRVGRAGRRGQSFASSLTFARDTPLDREAFREPVRYLTRKLRAPRVTLDSRRIVQRHVNALLLARWFQEAKGELMRVKAGAFFGFPMTLSEQPQHDPPVVRFGTWLCDPSTAAATEVALNALTRGTSLERDKALPQTTADMFREATSDFGRQWNALREQADKVLAEARAGLERQARRMVKEPLLKELTSRSILPGHGFPTAVLPFVTDCAENQNRRPQQDEEGEIGRNRRYDYPSRNADVALREYAPGAEVVVDGLVWTSAGVTLNWQRPTETGGSDHIQSIRWAWNCRECGEAGCEGVMSQTCLACDSPALEQTQFLEPAGFRVEWRCKPHADTDTVDYIEPQPVRISAREARWEPLLDPVLGRGRATADGLVFHHSMGANRQGYRICLECGRAAEEGTGDLRDHQALMPSKGGGGRCSGNDKTYAITRPVALGHEVLTDVAEFQPAALGSAGAAWALAAALREALSRRLGIEARELGLAVERRVGTLGEATHSIFLFDQSAGGAGYAPRLLDEIAGVLRDAAEVLNCPAECVKGCSSCVLVADLFAQQEIIDRCAALEFVKALQNEMIDPRADDIAGPGCRLSRPAADAIARRVRPGEVVAIWVHDELDMGALAQPPISTLFDVLARVGADVRLVLTERLTVQLDDSSRAGLRNASHRHGFTLWAGKPITAGNGAVLLATLAKGEETTAFLSRDPTAAMLGIGWGSGLDYPIVEMPFAGVAMEHIPDEAMERTAKTGDRVRIIASDAGRPIRLFGTGLVNNVLRGELEAAGLWRPGRLSALSYSDRYLKSPLAVLLMLRTAAALRTALAPSEAVIPLAIKTEPLRLDRHAGPPMRLCHDWSAENERASTIQELVVGFGFAPSFDSSHASHGRKLTIRYDDGVEAAMLFDQGFGYWRANSGDRHDFRVAPRLQAKAMLDSSAFVAGHGESYIAIVRILT